MITSLTAVRVDGDVPSAWGIYVQTKSKAKLTINGAAGSYGSTVSSYSITGGGYTSTASSFTTGFLNSSGSITFTATVTDSRGRVSAAATVTISVVVYSPPSFASYLSQRCLSNGTANDDGTYIRGLVSYSYASCGGKNTVTRATYYKKASDTAWTNASAAFSSGTAFTFGGGTISTETSYDIKYTLTDAFTTIAIQDIVSTAAVVMDFKRGGRGVAVGKVSEVDNAFEVSEDWDVRVYGKLLKDYIQSLIKTMYPVGSIYMSINATNPSAYFGGTWVAWGAGRVPVGINTADGNFNTVEKTGGASTIALTVAQMPAHTHTFTGSSATTSSKGAHTHKVGRDGDGASGSSTYTVHSAGVSGAGGTSPTGRKITVRGLMLHSVGCPQPKASVFISSWNSPSYNNAYVHGFIDGNDGTVYHTLPWNHRGWHCGSGSKGSGNNSHIGVEMCEPACIRYTGGSSFTCSDKAAAKAVAKRTYEAAVELFAMLCKQYSLNPTADGVIISHREGHSRGIASNHGDPEHLWNGLGMGYTMDGFRKAVRAKMNGSGGTGDSGSLAEPGTSSLQAFSLKNLSEADVIARVGPLFTNDQKESGILASVIPGAVHSGKRLWEIRAGAERQ